PLTSPFFPYTTLFRSPSAFGSISAALLRAMALLNPAIRSSVEVDSTHVWYSKFSTEFALFRAISRRCAPGNSPVFPSRITRTNRSEEHTSELQSRGHL